MILHILGGGPGQLNAIRRCRNLGITTFVTDMNLSAPGCAVADYSAEASTFDADRTSAAAETFMKKNGRRIDGLLVTATDQPVLTAALTAENLGIPYFLSPDKAAGVTNKKIMKRRLSEHGVPVSPYRCISEDFDDKELRGLNFPVVVKPLDSQGQRGVYRLNSVDEIRSRYQEVRGFGRSSEILVEEYFPSDEITVSGWLENGSLHILSATDRVTVDNPPGIGVCIAHHYPSKYNVMMPEITNLANRTVQALGLSEGPIYFQYLIGNRKSGGNPEIIVNEAAARIGGAYEDEFIPYITGIDILDIMLKMSCGIGYDSHIFSSFETQMSAGNASGVVSLQMFFCDEGMIDKQEGMEAILRLPGVITGSFLLKPGTVIGQRINSTQRAGYFVVTAETKEEADRITGKAYSLIKIRNRKGENLIHYYDKMLFGGNK